MIVKFYWIISSLEYLESQFIDQSSNEISDLASDCINELEVNSNRHDSNSLVSLSKVA